MATEALTAQTASRTGAQAALQSITTADGFTFPNNGRTLLYVENDAGALALVFDIVTSVDGQTGLTRTATITASESWFVGPFPVDQYNDADGLVTCTPDGDVASSTAVVQF